MIVIENLNYKDILTNINLKINDGDYVAIVGENGSGKSTLIKCIIGINTIGHNLIKIDGKCISCFKEFSQIGYVPQVSKVRYELPISVNEMLMISCGNKEKIKKLLADFHILHLKDMNVNRLSGGQRQKVNIIKAILNDINYLILDEPESGLDRKSREELQKMLYLLNQKGLTIIVVSHYLTSDNKDIKKIYDLDCAREEEVDVGI